METPTLSATLHRKERRPNGDKHRGRSAKKFGCLDGREQER